MILTDFLRFILTIILALSLTLDYPFALHTFADDTFFAEENTSLSSGYPWTDSDIVDNVTVHSPEDPCEDYHLYVNKDLILKKKYIEGYLEWNYYSKNEAVLDERAMDLIRELEPYDHDSALVRDMYDILADWDARDKTGFDELAALTDPILEAKSLEELTDYLMTKDGQLFIVNFISIEAEASVNDSKHYAVYIVPEDLLLEDSAEYSRRTEVGEMTEAYNNKMFTYYAGRLGLKEDEAEAMLDRAYDLEKRIAAYIPAAEEMLRDDYTLKSDNKMTFKELEELSVNYPLADIVEASGMKYDGEYIVSEPDYLSFLNSIYTDDNLEAIKSLIYIHALLDMGEYTDSEARDYEADTRNECYDSSYRYTDEENAYYSLKELLSEPLQKVYADKYGSEEDRKELEGLCRGVIESYREMLSDNTWASKETVEYTIEKLDAMKVNAAYPDEWTDYSDLSLEGCTLLEAVRRIWTFLDGLNDSRPGREVDNDCWAQDNNILACNAAYSPTENTIYIFLGAMEEPFYSEDMSDEELYASIGGFWVGHEISHSFDSNGSRFDAEGNIRDWWNREDKDEFRRRIDKLDAYLDNVKPFGDYTIKGKNVDVEMLADITGVQCALKMAEKEEDFDYDAFFRKYASLNVSMTDYTEELALLLQDGHPLDYLRTNVCVQQFDEFYDTYGVKDGDTMYLAPDDRLTVW